MTGSQHSQGAIGSVDRCFGAADPPEEEILAVS